MLNINECERINLKKGDILTKAADKADKVYLIVNGKVSLRNSYIRMELENGSIVGMVDLYSKECLFDCMALADTAVLAFNVDGIEAIDGIKNMGLNYQELIDRSMFYQFHRIYDIYKDNFENYIEQFKEKIGNNDIVIPDKRACEYLKDVSELGKGVFHGLFDAQNSIASYHMYLISRVISDIDILINDMINEFGYSVLGFEEPAIDKFEDQPIDKTKQDSLQVSESDMDYELVKNELKDSLGSIIDYADMDKTEAVKFKMMVESFRTLPDKNSSDNAIRQMRKRITEEFYNIYESVFLKYKKDENKSRLIEMFLKFGYMDEREFDEKTLATLYYFEPDINGGKYNVYTIYDWLTQIYEGMREPSKDEFDSDYKERFRELKRTKSYTKAEELAYFNDKEGKVRFEIDNLFRSTNRITSGEISVFYPILTQEKFTKDLKSMFLDKNKIEQAIDNVLDVDFSLFHREQMYYDEDNKIDNITIMKQVFPDIILMPNVGSKGIMWQEISEKKRDTPARFVLSEFFAGNLETTVIDIAGMFRWELCRTIQGNYWNDLREHSLTAEYCDYMQFYKKNKDLSEEIKDKIRTQYKNCRNNTREMFVKDYEAWIKYEAKGALRLNKVTRRILYIYCPASVKYRANLEKQPAFTDAAAQYERDRQKKIKELKGFNSNVTKRGGTITKVLEDNLAFYEDM